MQKNVKGYKKGKKGHVAHKEYRKRKAAAYLLRATCIACKKVFRSPVKRRMHVESGHKSDIGVNKNRTYKSSGLLG